MKVLTVFGTRPEAIKMAPVVQRLWETPGVESSVCVTGQHRELLDTVLTLFEITPEHDLDVMRAAQTLTHITTAVLEGLEEVLNEVRPDWVLVHGDTTTSMAAALAAFYQGVAIGHVEAGLRTRNLASPWPEEANRSITGRLASAHFAPTEQARKNLLEEAIPPDSVLVTGNTVIDALRHVVAELEAGELVAAEVSDFASADRPLILVTNHRRESFDGGLERTFAAIHTLATTRDVEIVYPVHPNPVVLEAASAALNGLSNVHLTEPLDYVPFVYLMDRAAFIVSDSGGVQEEAPALNTPVLVTREVTERPEALTAGAVRLVGTDTERILNEAYRLLDDPVHHATMSNAPSPYGDGMASKRIVDFLTR